MDDVSRLMQLSQEIGQVSQRFQPPDGQQFTGGDEQGLVEVTVAADGRPVRAAVREPWPGTTYVEEMEAAVGQAFVFAQQRRLEVWSEQMSAPDNQPTHPPPQDRPDDSFVTALSEHTVAGANLDEAMARMGDMMTQLLRAAQETGEQLAQDVQHENAATSEGVEVVVRGDGSLVSVRLDPRWARSQTAGGLSHHLTEALRRAARIGQPTAADAAMNASPMADLIAQMQDPYMLAHQLGLTRKGTQ